LNPNHPSWLKGWGNKCSINFEDLIKNPSQQKPLAFYPPLIGPKGLIILNTQIKVWVTKDPNLNPNKFIENLPFTHL
jgi:hypothetical protein